VGDWLQVLFPVAFRCSFLPTLSLSLLLDLSINVCRRGMNRCSFTEEETTKALIALYQVPAPESQNNMHGNLRGVITGVTLTNVRHPDQNHQNIGLHAMPYGGKKKDGLKEPSDATYKDGTPQLSNSMKKNLPASMKGRSLNDVSQSPLMGEPDFQQQSKSSDLPVKKHKEKQKVRDNYSDGGIVYEAGKFVFMKLHYFIFYVINLINHTHR
jgi:hypothetical protein